MKSNKVVNSFRYAFTGIKTAIKDERNMKIHLLAAMMVVALGILLHIQVWEWIVCIAWIVLVIGAEMFNTAIENTVDLVTKEYSQFAEKAKDVSAGAVLVIAVGAAVSGVLIFLPKIINLFTL